MIMYHGDIYLRHTIQCHIHHAEGHAVTVKMLYQRKHRMYYSSDIHMKHNSGGINAKPLGACWDNLEIAGAISCPDLSSIT